jgi:hypothetical protein
VSNPIKLAVGIPAYGGYVSAEQTRMWTEFGNIAGASNERIRITMFAVADCQPVDRARNMLLAQAMCHSSDWLLMIDADTWVKADKEDDAGFQLVRMISDGERAGAALVSAAVVRRCSRVEDGMHLAVYEPPGKDGIYGKGLPVKWVAEQRRALVPVHAVGAACFAVDLKKVAEAKIEYKFSELSEDLDFCRQIRTAFGDKSILVDPRVVTVHLSRPFGLTASMG